MFFLILVLVVNFAISWWNAYACGKAWAETKVAGGWNRLMVWCGAVMSATGFTWCYLFLLLLGAHAFGGISEYWTGIGIQLGYVILVPGLLLGGFLITVDSWARAYREGGVLNYGVAAYNTYAQVHNTMSAISNYGDAFGNVLEAFTGGGSSKRSSSKDDVGGVIVVILVIIALLGGVLTTAAIISKTAASDRLLTHEELERRRLQA